MGPDVEKNGEIEANFPIGMSGIVEKWGPGRGRDWRFLASDMSIGPPRPPRRFALKIWPKRQKAADLPNQRPGDARRAPAVGRILYRQ